MHAFVIIFFCVLAAVVYSVIHNQATARVCLEYFTVAHPPIFPTTSPTLLATGWGVIATWWVGLILGIGLAVAARAGSRPPRNWQTLLVPVAILMLIMACCAAIAGTIGWLAADAGLIDFSQFFRIPPERNAAFAAAAFAHNMSYASGFVGGLVVMWRVWRSRRSLGST